MPLERLQKFLAAGGIASRRKAEALITSGRVKVNQRFVTELGTRVDTERDLVTVDGKLVSAPSARSHYLLYKPPGCVTTQSDPEGRPTAAQYLTGVRARVFPVGRLDYDAEGAVLFTDDGELANRLAHPRYGHQRVYLVKVRGEPDPRALERMVTGVRLEDGPARALEVGVHERAERNVWIRMVVGEGRYHLVKRLCEAVGLTVQRLYRPEFGGVTVEGLRAGEFRSLTPGEVRSMRQRVGLAPGEGTAPPPSRKLPRAARRHGHGPPPVPGAVAPSTPEKRDQPRSHGGPEKRDPSRSPGGPPKPDPSRSHEGPEQRDRPWRRPGSAQGDQPWRRGGPAQGEQPRRRGGSTQRDQPRRRRGSTRTRMPPERIPAKKSAKK